MINQCSICGQAPVREACYHLCPNSLFWYSPEQERADDAHYGDDDMRERYAAEADDMALEGAWEAEEIPVSPADFLVGVTTDSDDIPF